MKTRGVKQQASCLHKVALIRRGLAHLFESSYFACAGDLTSVTRNDAGRGLSTTSIPV